MRGIKVTFTNGDIITTSINGTDEEIRKYYIGNTFNLSSMADEERGQERVTVGAKVDFLPKHKIHIEGRRWFQKTYGNTYHTCSIEIDGETYYTPKEYGYGDQYLETALSWLEANGYIEKREIHPNGCTRIPNWQFTKDNNITYRVSDVSREKDL